MAPYHHRQLFLLTIPTLAALLSYLWYKKKRIGLKSDTGDRIQIEKDIDTVDNRQPNTSTPVTIFRKTDQRKEKSPAAERSFSRSLSGVDSAPIDIILPREHRAKIAPVISDEDLDFEIEKVKSMKNTMESYNKFKSNATTNDSSTHNTNNDTTPKKTPAKEKCTPTKPSISSPKKANLNTPNLPKKNTNKKTNKNNVNHHQQKQPNKQNASSSDISKNVDTEPETKKLYELKIEDPKETKVELTCEEKVQNDCDKNGLVEKENEQLQRQSSERDSANHSPSDVMLASPSLSSISDNHSEGSSDSGKGGSEVATPPSRTPAVDASVTSDTSRIPMIYEFLIAQNLVGRLIGANGRFVTDIHNKTNAHILVKKHPNNNKMKVCIVEGTQSEINNAIKMIRDKFPLKRYPDLSLEQVSILTSPPQVSLIAHHIYLKLVEGVNNDTIVSCMVAPNHLFLQQPTHPTYPNLNILNSCMKKCYSNPDSPLLPTPIPENTVCVAQSVGEWYRAMVLSSDEETDMSYVSFLDYGGYAYVENSNLRQIRGDFMLLPFQAAECFLANIRPIGGESVAWSQEAYAAVADLTKGAIIYTQITEYNMDGVPLVLMYILEGPNSVIYLNQELVDRGYAEWITATTTTTTATATTSTTNDCEGAVGGVLA